MDPEDQKPQTDFKVRELRKLRFSATLQVFAAVFFASAAFIIGSAQGWGLMSAVFIALSAANIVFFIYVRKAMKSISQE
jgi:uncharacterized membrane protein YjjP (DUF1212 family)